MFPRMVAKTATPTTWLLPCSDHGSNVSPNGGKDNHSHYLAAPTVRIMEPMFPTRGAKDNQSPYLAAPMLVIMEPMFPTMMT